MKIQEQDIYHGTALAQIAECRTFTSINKVGSINGVYEINKDKRILIKYSTAEDSEWRFTINPNDYDSLACYEGFLVLICGFEAICALSDWQISEIIDICSEERQWVAISFKKGGGFKVRGSKGSLKNRVPHNSFPKLVLSEPNSKQEAFAWPPLSEIKISKTKQKYLVESSERMLDLSDTLGRYINGESLTVYFSLSSASPEWPFWSEARIKSVEKQIKYDLEFDAFKVKIERVTDPICKTTKKKDIPCSESFTWKLVIS